MTKVSSIGEFLVTLVVVATAKAVRLIETEIKRFPYFFFIAKTNEYFRLVLTCDLKTLFYERFIFIQIHVNNIRKYSFMNFK